MSDRRKEYAFVIPSSDAGDWTDADRLGQLMGGAYQHNTWVRIYGLDLRLAGAPQTGNVWYVHPEGSRRPVDVVNVAAFRTASELLAFLRELSESP
jgi:hypothetical protein